MAVYYKGQRVSWLIPGMKSREDISLDPKNFDPHLLPQRRIELDQDHTLVIIPDIPNRISTRKDGYIELILERHYDKEAKQSRNRKVIIGSDASGFLPGMMQANDNYFDLFDARGKLYHDPMQEEERREQNKQPNPSARTEHTAIQTNNKAGNKPKYEPDDKPKQTHTENLTTQTDRLPPKNQREQPAQTEGKKTDNDREEKLLRREREAIRKDAELKQKEQELQAWEEELERQQDEILLQISETERDHIKLLSYMLDSYIDTVDHQARRKPDMPMSKKQIRTINELLSELRDFFANSETESYLHLAEEPDEASDTPGTTNGEMALLLTAYRYTTTAYLCNDLRKKQKP